MTDLARWSLKVPPALDRDLRTFLAERGGRKGDLSRFVADAVSRELLDRTIDEIRTRNAHLDPDDVARLVDEELEAMREDFWADWRERCG